VADIFGVVRGLEFPTDTKVPSDLDFGAAAPVGTDRRAVRERPCGSPNGRCQPDSMAFNSLFIWGRWYEFPALDSGCGGAVIGRI
jgi:hypothetical protein